MAVVINPLSASATMSPQQDGVETLFVSGGRAIAKITHQFLLICIQLQTIEKRMDY